MLQKQLQPSSTITSLVSFFKLKLVFRTSDLLNCVEY